MRVARRVVAAVVFIVAAVFLVEGLGTFVALAAGAEADEDLGRRGAAVVGGIFAAAGFGLAWAGWEIWRAKARRD